MSKTVSMAGRKPGMKPSTFKRLIKALVRYKTLYLMLVIPLAFVFVFGYMTYPGLRMAFMDYRPARGWDSEWVGLRTFQKLFADRDFFRALRNTVLFNIADVILQFPAPIILALLVNELRFKVFKQVSQTILYMPHFLSSVIVASIAYTLFRPETGLVNVFLMNAGIIDKGIPFLTSNLHWVFTYLTINVWQAVGWSSIIYLAAIAGIDTQLYEAATVDGANRFRRLWHITLPGIKPTIVTLLIMRLGQLLGSGFERLNAFGNINVREVYYQISIYVYEKGLGIASNFSIATAMGMFQSLVGLLLVLGADRIAKLLGEEGLV